MSDPAGQALCIAMPAWNEEGVIERTARESLQALDGWPGGGQVLVVDDGSTDATPGILERLHAEDPRLRVVAQPHAGLAAAIETARCEARGEWVFLTGADDQWSSLSVLAMIDAVRDGADIVVGRRRAKQGYTPYRRLVSWAYNRLTVLLFGVPTHDAGSQRLVRRRLLDEIPRTSRSTFADAELLIRAQRLGHRVAVVDVDCRPRSAGVGRGARPRAVLAALLDLGRLWLGRARLDREGPRRQP